MHSCSYYSLDYESYLFSGKLTKFHRLYTYCQHHTAFMTDTSRTGSTAKHILDDISPNWVLNITQPYPGIPGKFSGPNFRDNIENSPHFSECPPPFSHTEGDQVFNLFRNVFITTTIWPPKHYIYILEITPRPLHVPLNFLFRRGNAPVQDPLWEYKYFHSYFAETSGLQVRICVREYAQTAPCEPILDDTQHCVLISHSSTCHPTSIKTLPSTMNNRSALIDSFMNGYRWRAYR